MAAENVVKPLPKALAPLDDTDCSDSQARDERKHKVVKVSYIDFKLKFLSEEPLLTYVLQSDEVDKQSLPVDATKGWERITTQRPVTGVKDNVYVHPSSKRQLRSLKEVKDYIHKNYDLVSEDMPPGKDLEQIPVLQVYILLDESELSSFDEKRKNENPQAKQNPKRGKRNKSSWGLLDDPSQVN